MRWPVNKQNRTDFRIRIRYFLVRFNIPICTRVNKFVCLFILIFFWTLHLNKNIISEYEMWISNVFSGANFSMESIWIVLVCICSNVKWEKGVRQDYNGSRFFVQCVVIFFLQNIIKFDYNERMCYWLFYIIIITFKVYFFHLYRLKYMMKKNLVYIEDECVVGKGTYRIRFESGLDCQIL